MPKKLKGEPILPWGSLDGQLLEQEFEIFEHRLGQQGVAQKY
jgi:hypothetical protein